MKLLEKHILIFLYFTFSFNSFLLDCKIIDLMWEKKINVLNILKKEETKQKQSLRLGGKEINSFSRKINDKIMKIIHLHETNL